MNDRFIAIVLTGVAIVWGLNTPVMKIGLLHISPMIYNVFRMLLATIFAYVALYLSKTYRPFERKDLLRLFRLSAGTFVVFQYFFTIGLQRTTSGNAALLFALLPVSVVIINRLFNNQMIKKVTAIGIGLSFIGVALIVAGSGKQVDFSSNYLGGSVLLLIGQVCYGFFTVYSKNLLNKYSIYQIIFSVASITTIFFTIMSAGEIQAFQIDSIPMAGWFSILFSGALSLCAGNFLWIWATHKVGSTKTAIYNNLSPVFALLGGYFFLQETIGLVTLGGSSLILLGVYLTTSAKQ